jgi:hypothetical protein
VDDGELTRSWRRADEPVAGHDLAAALLAPGRYERTRGVAQQAARAARLKGLGRAARRRLLSAAWLHDAGEPHGGWEVPLTVARTLRRAGQESLARIIAHSRNTPMAAALADRPPVVAEFPRPDGEDAVVLSLLDLALLTTRADGAPGGPRDALRDRAAGLGPGDPGVRALVALVARLADDAAAREIVETLGRRGA